MCSGTKSERFPPTSFPRGPPSHVHALQHHVESLLLDRTQLALQIQAIMFKAVLPCCGTTQVNLKMSQSWCESVMKGKFGVACAVKTIDSLSLSAVSAYEITYRTYYLDASVILTWHLYVSMNTVQAWPYHPCRMQSIQHFLTIKQQTVHENLTATFQGRLTSRKASLKTTRKHACPVDSGPCVVHQWHSFKSREEMSETRIDILLVS